MDHGICAAPLLGDMVNQIFGVPVKGNAEIQPRKMGGGVLGRLPKPESDEEMARLRKHRENQNCRNPAGLG